MPDRPGASALPWNALRPRLGRSQDADLRHGCRLGTEWVRYNIQCSAIASGYFRTELTAALLADPVLTTRLEQRIPAGRWAEIDKIGGAAACLPSDAASFVNGTMPYADGGITPSV